MQSVPTVYMDRVNVGGSESGQQSNYNAKGAQHTDNTVELDGVPITDMGDTSPSPSRPGLGVLLRLRQLPGDGDHHRRRRRAEPDRRRAAQHGAARRDATRRTATRASTSRTTALQAVNISPELAAALGNTTGKGNRTDEYQDYGFDLGGPLLKDRVWVWGTIARTNINLLTLTGDAGQHHLQELRVQGRRPGLNPSVRGNFTFYENNKIKNGRERRPDAPAGNHVEPDRPDEYFKGEGNFVVGNRLFATAKDAHVDGGFVLAPAGGLGTDYYIDDGGVAHNTFYQFRARARSTTSAATRSFFAGQHEVKFGGALAARRRWTRSRLAGQPPGCDLGHLPEHARAGRARLRATPPSANYINGYVTDTMSLDRLTLTGGVRFDHQSSSLGAASVPAVAGFDSLLPAISARPVQRRLQVEQRHAAARHHLALDSARKTVVRASYAMFASQLPGDAAEFVSPIQYSYAYYNARRPERRRRRTGERSAGQPGAAGLLRVRSDATRRERCRSTRWRPTVKPPTTHEFLVGVDRQLVPNFAVSATYHLPRLVDVLWTPLDRRDARELHADVDAHRHRCRRSARSTCRSTR